MIKNIILKLSKNNIIFLILINILFTSCRKDVYEMNLYFVNDTNENVSIYLIKNIDTTYYLLFQGYSKVVAYSELTYDEANRKNEILKTQFDKIIIKNDTFVKCFSHDQPMLNNPFIDNELWTYYSTSFDPHGLFSKIKKANYKCKLSKLF
jgi:hypothetical protein